MSIHSKLSAVLGIKRIKQSELARLTGVSKTTINALYNDKVQKVDYTILNKICDVLKCDISDILEYIED
jgi:putative transcriptional regulator